MRLTDRARAAVLKAIIDRMEAGGFEVAEENKIMLVKGIEQLENELTKSGIEIPEWYDIFPPKELKRRIENDN